jgi:hypothetical protein
MIPAAEWPAKAELTQTTDKVFSFYGAEFGHLG